MLECQPLGVEGMALCLGPSVEFVSDQRPTLLGHMHPNLVGSSGFETNGHLVATGSHFGAPYPMGPGRSGPGDSNGLNLSPERVVGAAQRQVDRPLIALGRHWDPGNGSDHGQVLLGDLMGIEKRQNRPQGLFVLGEEDQARGLSIDPVGRVGYGPVRVSGVSHKVDEVRGVGFSHSVDQQISGLVRDEEPFVLGGHGPAKVGGGLLNVGHPIGENLSLLEFLCGVRLAPVEEESPLGNRGRPGVPVEIREPIDEVVDESSTMSDPGNAGRLVQGPRIEGEAWGVKNGNWPNDSRPVRGPGR